VTIAENRNNHAPVTLTMKAKDLIAELYAKTSVNRTPGPGKTDKGSLCDICTKPESDCQSAATNLNGSDHAFVNMARAEFNRNQQHADGRIAAARANALDRVAKSGRLFRGMADIDQPIEPEQESA
jgi:hypothetical protein